MSEILRYELKTEMRRKLQAVFLKIRRKFLPLEKVSKGVEKFRCVLFRIIELPSPFGKLKKSGTQREANKWAKSHILCLRCLEKKERTITSNDYNIV